jgi:DNA mismatch endonuclease (patch repair protein)
MERDAETTALLQANGWTVVRVWEHEDVAVAVGRVVQALTP